MSDKHGEREQERRDSNSVLTRTVNFHAPDEWTESRR